MSPLQYVTAVKTLLIEVTETTLKKMSKYL